MYPHFKYRELEGNCGCGRADMDPLFMDRLEDLRTAYDAPIYLSSAFRCPTHNDRVSTTGLHGPHTTGRAVDILIRGSDAYTLILLAMQFGFSGIGIKQHGRYDSRFVHLDDLSYPDFPRPWVWSY